MTRREYRVYCEGMEAAADGRGLSGAPYTDGDGVHWRDGWWAWYDAHAAPDVRHDRRGDLFAIEAPARREVAAPINGPGEASQRHQTRRDSGPIFAPESGVDMKGAA